MWATAINNSQLGLVKKTPINIGDFGVYDMGFTTSMGRIQKGVWSANAGWERQSEQVWKSGVEMCSGKFAKTLVLLEK
jgi:hypothetical protein